MKAEKFLKQLGIPEKELQNLPWFDYGNLLTWLEEYAKIQVNIKNKKS